MVLGDKLGDKATLEEILSSVSGQAELWAAVYDKIISPHSTVGKFTNREAAAFIEAGKRAGLDSEALVLEYWSRAGKDGLHSALDAARAALASGYAGVVDVHKGYDLQHAVERHLGWMRDAGIEVPVQILTELKEHGKVLAEHAEANRFHGDTLMPVVEMFAPLLDPSLLRKTRVSSAKQSLAKSFGRSFDDYYREAAENAAAALRTLEQYSALDESAYSFVLYSFGTGFVGNNGFWKKLLELWDWAPHADDIYGRLVVAMANPEVGRVSTWQWRLPEKDAADILRGWHSSLSEKVMPSPAAARILDAGLESFPNMQIKMDAADAEAVSFLEGLIKMELEHKGLTAVISPQHLGNLIKLYAGFGGELAGSLMNSIQSYIEVGLLTEDIDEISSLAAQAGIMQDVQMGIYTRTLTLLAVEAKKYAAEQIAANDANHDVIRGRKELLFRVAWRVVGLSGLVNDRTVVHKAMSDAALAVQYTYAQGKHTRFGIGLHYLSSLIVRYSQEFSDSPLEIITSGISPENLKEYFQRELQQNSRAPISRDEKRDIAWLYNEAHTVLYGSPISIPAERTERGVSGVIRQTAPQAPIRQVPSSRIIVYIGSKSVNGSDHDTVELLRLGLEEKLAIATLELERGSVPGKGQLYGIGMSPDDFVSAVRQGIMPPVQALYFEGNLPKAIDTGKFSEDRADGGVYVTTAPSPQTFAIHQLKSVAMALSGKKPAERNTAWHHKLVRKN